MDAEKIEAGIAAYRHERKVLFRLIRRFGPISESVFDRLLRGREYRRPKFIARPINGDSYILGFGINGGTMWAEWLELLQYMSLLGEVRIEKINGEIHYKVNRDGGE